MKKYLALVSALLVTSLTLAPLTKVYALGEAETAVVVSPEDAAKKYPMPKGKDYPMGSFEAFASNTGGFVRSPYSSRIYDCRKIGHGALILDEGAKKVFRAP
jgi:hypothetical protein